MDVQMNDDARRAAAEVSALSAQIADLEARRAAQLAAYLAAANPLAEGQVVTPNGGAKLYRVLEVTAAVAESGGPYLRARVRRLKLDGSNSFAEGLRYFNVGAITPAADPAAQRVKAD